MSTEIFHFDQLKGEKKLKKKFHLFYTQILVFVNFTYKLYIHYFEVLTSQNAKFL